MKHKIATLAISGLFLFGFASHGYTSGYGHGHSHNSHSPEVVTNVLSKADQDNLTPDKVIPFSKIN